MPWLIVWILHIRHEDVDFASFEERSARICLLIDLTELSWDASLRREDHASYEALSHHGCHAHKNVRHIIAREVKTTLALKKHTTHRTVACHTTRTSEGGRAEWKGQN